MSLIFVAQLAIEGTRPLLWNAFTLDKIPLHKKEKRGVAGNDPAEWKRSVLATTEGQLFIEPTYAFGMLRDGAKYVTAGRGSIQPRVAATLQVLDGRIMTNRYLPQGMDDLPTDPTAPVYLDIRSVKNPGTSARNIRYRVAAAPGWQMSFQILWDATIVSREEMQSVAVQAGRLAGLGDGRKLGFGRFEVVAFEVHPLQ